VATRHEEIATELRKAVGLDAKAVHSIKAEKHLIVFFALCVHFSQHRRHVRDGYSKAGAGMHPCQRHEPRLRADARADSFDRFVRTGLCR
jgi:hypothetical protein